MKPDLLAAPDLVVVIPTFNKAGNLRPLLMALVGQTMDHSRFEVIVVDDCSTDGTGEVLKQLVEESTLSLRALRTERNTGGPSKPRNIGWRSSQAPIVAFLDDDCLPTPGWLEAAVACMQANPDWGVMQGRTIAPPEVDIMKLTRWQVVRIVEGPSPHFEATNIFYRREALERVGGFDETISWWGEDIDLGWRVREIGWANGFSEGAIVLHEVADRGWRWHLKFGWLDQRLIEVASRHPQFRREGFWRPWALNRVDAEYALALIGLALAFKWKPAAVLALPYTWRRRPPFRRDGINGRSVAVVLQSVAVDTLRFAGHMKGSISARILVL